MLVLRLCGIPPESAACAEPQVPAAHQTIPLAGVHPSAFAPVEPSHPAGEPMPGQCLGACPRIGAVARESWFDSDFSII